MSSYLTGAGSTRQTPQAQPIPGTSQVENSAGGYAFELGPLERLRRFLILGTEGGTYYATERQITDRALAGVRLALDELGGSAVDEIVAISQQGRAPRNDEAIYALAMATGHSDPAVRRLALIGLPKVCRIGTHLFQFMEAVKHFRGHGRALNTAIRRWYTDKDPADLAYQLVKYRQRGGWTHADVLRKVKPTATGLSPAMDKALGWAARGVQQTDLVPVSLASIVAFEYAQPAATPQRTAELVGQFGAKLPWEALRTDHLTDPVVIEALVPTMPLGALVRQLGRMSAAGALKLMSSLTTLVAERVADEEAVRKSKLHPIKVLSALATYQQGHGARGSLLWEPAHEIVDALDAAFYHAFGNVERTGKRHLLALDVSGSMTWGEIAGVPGLTPRVVSAAMAMVQARVGDPYHVMAFTGQPVPLEVSARERLDDVLRKVDALEYGRTDCAVPMLYALRDKLDVDGFVVYTDNETWFGQVHPSQALQMYRDQRVPDAKLAVVGMTATEFSIADPADSRMLDFVGFDSAAPQLLADFIADRI